jgi:hypothetical protein
MRSKFFTISLICAAACLVAANVNADLLTTVPTASPGKDVVALGSYNVQYHFDWNKHSWEGTLQPMNGGSVERVNNPAYDYSSKSGEWMFKIDAPKDYAYFTLTQDKTFSTILPPGRGPMGLKVNDTTLFGSFEPYTDRSDEWWRQKSYSDLGALYLDNQVGEDGLLTIGFETDRKSVV